MIAVLAWKKHRLLAFAALVVFTSIGFLAASRVEPKFESEASLYLRLGRESSGLDPTATLSEMTPIYETRAQEVNSAVQVMNSRKILEAVIGVIGSDVILNPETFDAAQWQTALQQTLWPELDPSIPHTSNALNEKAVETIYKAVSFEVERESNVISVTSTSKTPEVAQAITTTLLQAFQAEHVRLNETSGFQFFADQVAQLQAQLEQARNAVVKRKTELGVMSITAARERLESVLTEIQKQLNAAIPQLSGSKAAVLALRQSISNLPNRTQPMDASDTLKKRQFELEQERSLLLTKFTPSHRRVHDVQTELQLVREQLTNPDNRNAANPTLRELEVALAVDLQKVAELEASVEQLRQQQQNVTADLLQLNAAETEMLALEDRVADLKEATSKASQRLEQARVLEALSQERISNIRIVQPPTFNPQKMSPSRTLLVMGGAVIGLIAAVILPALIEFGRWYLNTLKSEATISAGPDLQLKTSH